jgi:hypothetical protein
MLSRPACVQTVHDGCCGCTSYVLPALPARCICILFRRRISPSGQLARLAVTRNSEIRALLSRGEQQALIVQSYLTYSVRRFTSGFLPLSSSIPGSATNPARCPKRLHSTSYFTLSPSPVPYVCAYTEYVYIYYIYGETLALPQSTAKYAS